MSQDDDVVLMPIRTATFKLPDTSPSNSNSTPPPDNMPHTSLVSSPWSIQQTPCNKSTAVNVTKFAKISKLNLLDIAEENNYGFTPTTNNSSSTSTSSHSYTNAAVNIVADNIALQKYGYKILRIICDTMHGCVYEAKIIKTNANVIHRNGLNFKQNSQKIIQNNNNNNNKVAIKKVDKNINNVANNDGYITKEAIILHYLTVDNKPPASNLCEFIDFIETNDSFYLILEHGGSQNLAQFVNQAHEYMQQKRLKLKEWRIVVKFLFWQISVMIHWMHNDMYCCHLDLDLENIMIQNGNFVENQLNGTVSIDASNLSVKIGDFGFAEVFQFDNAVSTDNDDQKQLIPNNNHNIQSSTNLQFEQFDCIKTGLAKHKSPQYYNGNTFDARKADCFSLGIILFTMFTGSLPFMAPASSDKGYAAIQNKTLKVYLTSNGLIKYIHQNALLLVEGLLDIGEEERTSTSQVINSDWFAHYYQKYKYRIEQKSKLQKQLHLRQKHKYKLLPYFSLHGKHCVL